MGIDCSSCCKVAPLQQHLPYHEQISHKKMYLLISQKTHIKVHCTPLQVNGISASPIAQITNYRTLFLIPDILNSNVAVFNVYFLIVKFSRKVELCHSETMPSVLWRCWLDGRKRIWSGKNWVTRCWHGYLFGPRCKWLAHGPADATPTPSSLLQQNPELFYPSGTRSGLIRVVLEKGM